MDGTDTDNNNNDAAAAAAAGVALRSGDVRSRRTQSKVMSFTAPPARSSFTSISAPPFHVRALFSWTPQSGEQLPIAEQDVLQVTKLLSPDWWLATNVATNVSGQVPSPSHYEEYYKTTDAWVQKQMLAKALEEAMKGEDSAVRFLLNSRGRGAVSFVLSLRLRVRRSCVSARGMERYTPLLTQSHAHTN